MPADTDPLARLEALLKAATPGPWAVHSEQRTDVDICITIEGPEHFGFCGDDSNDVVRASMFGGVSTFPNAALIVALVNAAPALLAEIRAGRAFVRRRDQQTTSD